MVDMHNRIIFSVDGATAAQQAMDAILDAQRRHVGVGKELIKDIRERTSESNLELRVQNQLVRSWRLSHPELSLLSRGLSNVASVGHTLVNAFNSLNLMQLRQKETGERMAEALQKQKDLTLEYSKAIKNFGSLDPKTLEIKGKLDEATAAVGKLSESLKAEKWQDIMTKFSIALSLGGSLAQILNAYSAIRGALIGAGGLRGAIAIVGASFKAMWAKALLPVAVALTIDYFISKARGLPAFSEIAFKGAEDILTTGEPSQEAKDLFNKRMKGEGGASLIGMTSLPSNPLDSRVPQAPQIPTQVTKPEWWEQLKNAIISGLSIKTNAGLAFGETGAGISNVANVPFGPPQPTARQNYIAGGGHFGQKAAQLAAEATNTESQRNSELANIQANQARIEQEIAVERESIIPNIGVPSTRLQSLVAEQSKLETARTELSNIVQRRDQAQKFKDLTGIDLDTYNRVAKIAYDAGVSIADVSPAIGVRLGLKPNPMADAGGLGFSQGGGVGVSSIGGIADYEKAFGPDIALLGSINLGGHKVSAEEYRIQQQIANGAPIIAVPDGSGGFRPTAIDLPPAGQRSARENFIANMYGLAGGGVINEPIIGMGMRSGSGYMFGERGPETITPGRGGVGSITIHVHGSLITESDLIDKVSESIARRVQRQVR